MSKNDSTPKKPIYKKWWFWLIIAALLVGLIGSCGNKDSDSGTTTAAETTTATTASETMTTTAPAAQSPLQKFVAGYAAIDSSINIPVADALATKAAGAIAGLNADVTYNSLNMIVSIHGSAQDLETMKQAARNAAKVFDPALTDDAINAGLSSVGQEGGQEASQNVRFITSAPNEFENEYRIDVYGYNFA